LVTKDSIEERIVDLHREKRNIADALLDDSGAAGELSREALLSLLSME
jgi:SNF2 family DNA or RNA helicase